MDDDQTGCITRVNGGINNIDSTPHASGSAANQAGSSFSLLPNATSFEQQLSTMESRGLVINDRDFAIAKLQDFNYYRLRGYWLSFARALLNYNRECDRAYNQGVPYVVHNVDKYGKLPIWAAVEIMSFGTLSMFYGNLDRHVGTDANGISLGKAIAEAFGTKPRYLKSWTHHLTTVRNIAAHHDRFYNRVMNIRPLLLKQDRRYASNKQFPTLLVIKRIYEKSWPDEWGVLAGELLACFGRHSNVNVRVMGFPANWKDVLGLI